MRSKNFVPILCLGLLILVFGITGVDAVVCNPALLGSASCIRSYFGNAYLDYDNNINISSWLDFDGVNDRIEFGNSTDFDNVNDTTISAWIHVIQNSTAGGIAGKWDYNYQKQYLLNIAQNRKLAFTWSPNLTQSRGGGNSNETVPLSQWSYVVSILNRSHYAFYIDGEFKGGYSRSDYNIIGNGPSNFSVGEYYLSQWFNGSIDNVKLYNTSLSSYEIKDLFNKGRNERDTSFTIVQIPDLQNYMNDVANASIAYDMINWILDNRDSLNIKFVSVMGDITNSPTSANLNRSFYALNQLTNVIPWATDIGNHDYFKDADPDRNLTSFQTYYNNSYFNTTRGWGGNYDTNYSNNYQLFSALGTDYIIFHLEQFPTNNTLNWVNFTIGNYSTRKVILSVHGFLDDAGKIDTDDLLWYNNYYASRNSVIGYNLTGNEPIDIWNNYAINWANLSLILCGHKGLNGADVYNISQGLNGNNVTILMNQHPATPSLYNSNMDGTLRYLVFKPIENKIYTYTYSTKTQYYNDTGSRDLIINEPQINYNILQSLFNFNEGSIAHDDLFFDNNGSIIGATWNNDYVNDSYLYLKNIGSATSIVYIYNLSSPLIYYSNGSGFIASGSNLQYNLTLAPNNWTFVLENYNLTEGVGRENDVLWFSYADNNEKHIANNLTDTVSAQLIFNVTNCANVTRINFTSQSGVKTSYTSGWTCNNDVLNMTFNNIEPATSSNVILITYVTPFITFTEPLDLKRILIDNLSGTAQIFLLISLVTIACLAGMFRMANYIMLVMVVIFGIMFADYFKDFAFLAITISGMLIGWSIGAIIKR